MANQGRQRYEMESLGPGRVRIGGRFRPNAASAIDNTLNEGSAGWTVAWTSTGLFTVTLEDVWSYAFDKSLSLEHATAVDLKLQWGAIDLNARTLQIRSLAVATLTNIASDPGNWVNWGIWVKRTTAGGKR
jgi:hypothetical protein